MKKLILLLPLLFIFANAYCIDYDSLIKENKTKVELKKKEVKALEKSLKLSPNDVAMHKELVRKNLEVDSLNNVVDKIKVAKDLNKKLAKENEKFDEYKVNLLNLKSEAMKADEAIEEYLK